MRSATRGTILSVAKFALGAAILVWLAIQARDGFRRVMEETIDWPLLVGALACTFLAAMFSFVRWHVLIRALGLEMQLLNTLRLGALGMALNFVSPGAIGGDLFKAIFLAHGQPGRRTEAVATVIIDRVMGLLTMLLFASVGILATDLLNAPTAPLRLLCQAILLSATIGWLGVGLLLLVPAFTGPVMSGLVEKLPIVGHTVARILGAVRVYRNQKGVLLKAFGLSALVAVFFISSFYLVARGLPIHEPTWAQHAVIVPVAGLVGAIPLTPSGLGTQELAIEELYEAVPGGQTKEGDGTLVAITRRATEICVALLGLAFYLTHRREVEEIYAEAEAAAEAS